MRKCPQCGTAMIDRLFLNENPSATYLIKYDKNKLFPKKLGRIKAALCPECGEVSIYMPQGELKKAVNKTTNLPEID